MSEALMTFDDLVADLGIRFETVKTARGSIRIGSVCSADILQWMDDNEDKVRGKFSGGKSPLSSSGVAGVQMAEVAVDKETGVVKMKKFVAVQDMGLVINRKTASSQIYGAMIMGIAYALF